MAFLNDCCPGPAHSISICGRGVLFAVPRGFREPLTSLLLSFPQSAKAHLMNISSLKQTEQSKAPTKQNLSERGSSQNSAVLQTWPEISLFLSRRKMGPMLIADLPSVLAGERSSPWVGTVSGIQGPPGQQDAEKMRQNVSGGGTSFESVFWSWWAAGLRAMVRVSYQGFCGAKCPGAWRPPQGTAPPVQAQPMGDKADGPAQRCTDPRPQAHRSHKQWRS